MRASSPATSRPSRAAKSPTASTPRSSSRSPRSCSPSTAARSPTPPSGSPTTPRRPAESTSPPTDRPTLTGKPVGHRRANPRPGSRPPMEPVVATGQSADVVPSVVRAVVMPGAEKDPVLDVGGPTLGPGAAGMVRLAPGSRNRASFGTAAPVAHGHRLALSRSEEPAAATEVEHLGLPAEDDRDDLRGAREPAGMGGADRLLADQADTRQP